MAFETLSKLGPHNSNSRVDFFTISDRGRGERGHHDCCCWTIPTTTAMAAVLVNLIQIELQRNSVTYAGCCPSYLVLVVEKKTLTA